MNATALGQQVWEEAPVATMSQQAGLGEQHAGWQTCSLVREETAALEKDPTSKG